MAEKQRHGKYDWAADVAVTIRNALRADVPAIVRLPKIGEQLVLEAVARARAAGCGLVQLTSDASRVDARRFYERLGFQATHIGMKLSI